MTFGEIYLKNKFNFKKLCVDYTAYKARIIRRKNGHHQFIQEESRISCTSIS